MNRYVCQVLRSNGSIEDASYAQRADGRGGFECIDFRTSAGDPLALGPGESIQIILPPSIMVEPKIQQIPPPIESPPPLKPWEERAASLLAIAFVALGIIGAIYLVRTFVLQ